MDTSINVHLAGKLVTVTRGTGTSCQWLSIPLSEDKTATVVVFLEPADCERLGQELLAIADRARRVAEIDAPTKREPCFQCDGDGMIGLHNCPRCGGGGKEIAQ